jgi:hypothetical protein
MSRVHRRLIEPIETEQDNEPRLSFQHTVFVRPVYPTGTPATMCGSGSESKAQCHFALRLGAPDIPKEGIASVVR